MMHMAAAVIGSLPMFRVQIPVSQQGSPTLGIGITDNAHRKVDTLIRRVCIKGRIDTLRHAQKSAQFKIPIDTPQSSPNVLACSIFDAMEG